MPVLLRWLESVSISIILANFPVFGSRLLTTLRPPEHLALRRHLPGSRGRIERWALRLQQYDPLEFNLKSSIGKRVTKPDLLFRISLSCYETSARIRVGKIPCRSLYTQKHDHETILQSLYSCDGFFHFLKDLAKGYRIHEENVRFSDIGPRYFGSKARTEVVGIVDIIQNPREK